ncbi:MULTISPECIES: WXG100 family type VII secretion target [Prauserella]|uniref:ESAT-6-like protein n=3 Tax=Prauserella TaxID=142577 RepID=A0A839XDU2_9PSEU|nr:MULTISPECIES: WXG100 family type VII secretion target [Prauserella]MBB3662112.1 WXG100 family type VII secretion target [Prauserella sediminis]MCP2182540.1 WXG100 family type VII secretion target [Prauserella alba]MCR3719804.1 WXG100 family type VII secretion target [Prauserella flava]MCR3736653.1 WXG100 family type VII secretion target [Prauserella salsuginis]
MAGIKVDYATIQTAAEDCKSTGSELEALFEQLKSNLAPLTSEWEGDAMAAWQELQQNWNNSLDELKQVLAQIATALPQIADSYQGTEQGIKGMFG